MDGKIIYMDYLVHHGVKGMRWGVRKAQKVSNRLAKIKSSDRYKYGMSDKQKASFRNAEQYWNARAQGKKPTQKRNIIKRSYDVSRSYSLGQRAVATVVGNTALMGIGMAEVAAANKIMEKAVGANTGLSPMSLFKPGSIVSSSASSMLLDELLNKVAGHY